MTTRKQHWHQPRKGAACLKPADIRKIAAMAEPGRRVLDNLPEEYETAHKRGNKRRPGVDYYNAPIAFDIESTSTYIGGHPVAWMYVWQCWFNGHVYIGRSWDEWEAFLAILSSHFGNVILPIYVHNLAFEFSFLKQIFRFDDVFATRPLTPCRARCGTVEYRDSLVLSGLPLAKLPTKTKKLVGELDYSLVRHEKTPLTKTELAYCVNDVVVLAEYIEHLLEDDDMAKIPMTRTGYVRRDISKRMAPVKGQIHTLTLDMTDYKNLEQLYSGGFTHAAKHTSGMLLHSIRSLDITSSYPTVMLVEQYPMSNWWDVAYDDIPAALDKYCCYFDLEVRNLKIRENAPDCLISQSKCMEIDPEAIINNGRVHSADRIVIKSNEIDYKWYRRFYTGEWYISNMRAARKGHLPKPIIEAILYYYHAKTAYKGVKGKEELYALCKERLNAMYGMMATKILRDLIALIDGEWYSAGDWARDKKKGVPLIGTKRGEYANRMEAASIDEYRAKQLNKWNDSFSRFLTYSWAPWVTAYARQNLWMMMWKCGEDYHYTDTDSLKISNWHLHKSSFDRFNRRNCRRIHDVLTKLRIDPELARPKDPSGIVRPLGVYTDEGEYWDFKTLGAKRYLTDGLEGLTATVAGAPKKAITKYLASKENPFAAFRDTLCVPAEKSGKLMATHIEDPWEGMVTDYLGNSAYVYAPGGTHLEPMAVNLKISEQYLKYLAQANASDNLPYIDRGLTG